MSAVIAEVRVSGPGVALSQHTLPEASDSTIQINYQPAEKKVVLVVESCQAERFQTVLEDDPSVVEFVPIVSDDGTCVGSVTVEELFSAIYPDHDIQVISTVSPAGADDWKMRLRAASREKLIAIYDHCQERGIDISFEKVFTESDPFTTAIDGGEQNDLTDRQREALDLAFEDGYFDVPRRTTLRELADQLDVSEQAMSELLRRGVTALLKSRFG